jgi:hypothetical protein
LLARHWVSWLEESVKRGIACFASLPAAVLAVAAGLFAQNVRLATETELSAITERGRALAEYDQAAWHATDAVQMANPKTAEGQHYIAKRENGKWIVAFGVLNADRSKFLVGYEAEQLAKPKEFSVQKNDPAREDEGFYLFAARAMQLASTEFAKENRPYNAAVFSVTGADAKEQQGPADKFLPSFAQDKNKHTASRSGRCTRPCSMSRL